MKKPPWLDKRIDLAGLTPIKRLRNDLNLNTVCEQALCPNIGECFAQKSATFLLLGDTCSRRCRFCGIKSGALKPLDKDEPRRVAQAVKGLGLKTVVLTSVCRDDLADKGAGAFIECLRHIRVIDPEARIETLIPDFGGKQELLRRLVEAKPDILSHNIETVERLYPLVRGSADYRRSLGLLRKVKDIDKSMVTKSSLMLGLGETPQEVTKALKDLREVGCNCVSIGQYLAPSKRHYPVRDYIRPETFEAYRQEALNLGFDHVVSMPYARSSYKAATYFTGN